MIVFKNTGSRRGSFSSTESIEGLPVVGASLLSSKTGELAVGEALFSSTGSAVGLSVVGVSWPCSKTGLAVGGASFFSTGSTEGLPVWGVCPVVCASTSFRP